MSFTKLPKELVEKVAAALKNIREDDMPNDAVFHKDGDESAEKKKDLSEETPESSGQATEECGCGDSSMLHKKAKVDAHSGLPELGEDEKEDKERVDGPPWAKGMAASQVQENYASPEPCSAVGFRELPEVAKRADLVHDISIIGEEKFDGYRLLIQYPNHRCEMIPSADLPPAPTLESLAAITLGLPDPHGVIAAALAVPVSGPDKAQK